MMLNAALQIDQRIGSDDLQVSPPSMYLYHMLELLHCPWQELRVLFCPSLLYLQFLVELTVSLPAAATDKTVGIRWVALTAQIFLNEKKHLKLGQSLDSAC